MRRVRCRSSDIVQKCNHSLKQRKKRTNRSFHLWKIFDRPEEASGLPAIFGSMQKACCASAAFFWYTRESSRQNIVKLSAMPTRDRSWPDASKALSFWPIIISHRRTGNITVCIYGRISVIKAVDSVSLFLLEVTTNLVISWRILRTTEPYAKPCSHGFKICCRLLENELDISYFQ